MHMRNTVLMAALLIVLAGFVYFWEIRGREEREDAERLANLLVHFEVEEVERVEVTTGEGTVVASKSDGTWRIEQPAAVPADGEAIDSLVDRVHNAKLERQIVETAEDLAPFGLDEPVAKVTLGLADGRSVSLAIGKETPVGANVYATADDSGSVYSVAATIKGGLDKKLFDLRDKTALAFEESAIETIELKVGDLAATLRRDDGDSSEPTWTASAPFAGRADADTIDDLLSSLHTAEAEAFVLDSAPGDEQLLTYGLLEPAARVILRDASGSSHELLIGAESEDPAGHYAMRAGGQSVFVVAADVLEDLPASVDSLRNKQVLALARERVKTMTIRQGDASVTLEREGVDWRITAPRALEADASVVSGLLSTLQDLRAEGFAQTFAGDASLVVTVGLGDAASAGVEETVELRVGPPTRIVPLSGDADEDAEQIDARAVAASGDSTVYLVADDELEDLRADLFELRAKTLVQFTQADLTQIEISAAGSEWVMAHGADSWTLTAPENRPLDESIVSDLLWDINYLRMEGVASEWDAGAAPGGLEAWGLGVPRLTVLARTADGVVANVRIGNEVAGVEEAGSARVYALVGDRPGVFEIRASVADAIEELAEKLGSE